MYNRQEEPNGLPLPTTLEEQLNLPIIKLVLALREGKTQKVAIKTFDGFFISAINGGGGYLIANATGIGTNETFLLIPQGLDRSKIAIRTANGNYVSAVNGGGGIASARSTTIGANEQFTLVAVNPDKANFVTAGGFLLLALTTEPRLLTAYGLATGPRTRLTVIPQAI